MGEEEKAPLLGPTQAQDKLHLAHGTADATGNLRVCKAVVGQTIDFLAAAAAIAGPQRLAIKGRMFRLGGRTFRFRVSSSCRTSRPGPAPAARIRPDCRAARSGGRDPRRPPDRAAARSASTISDCSRLSFASTWAEAAGPSRDLDLPAGQIVRQPANGRRNRLRPLLTNAALFPPSPIAAAGGRVGPACESREIRRLPPAGSNRACSGR